MFSEARLRPWEMNRFTPRELDQVEEYIEARNAEADAAASKRKASTSAARRKRRR